MHLTFRLCALAAVAIAHVPGHPGAHAHDAAAKRAIEFGQRSLGNDDTPDLRKRAVEVVTEYYTAYATVVEEAAATTKKTSTKAKTKTTMKTASKAKTTKKHAATKTTTSKKKKAAALSGKARSRSLSKSRSKSRSKSKSRFKSKSRSKSRSLANSKSLASAKSATPASSSHAYSSASTALSLCAVPVVKPASLAAHNALRTKHGAADLAWSSKLQVLAQTWADKCVWADGGGESVGAASNVAAISGSKGTTAEQVTMWAEEASEYRSSDPEYSHFTQMVWKATTHVGCAMTTCSTLKDVGWSGTTNFYVCQYYPAGNVYPASNFRKNVEV